MAVSAEPKIAVVGCGIAGIAAALRLVQAGFRHVRILEATARSGGRIRTVRLGFALLWTQNCRGWAEHFNPHRAGRGADGAAIGNNIVEMGASYIHGPSEDNPVFCLARDYGLLGPEALTAESQAMAVNEHLPYVPLWLTSSGQRLSSERMNPAAEMFVEILDDASRFENKKEAPWASIGHYVRAEAQQRAVERWKDKDATTRALLRCAISAMLKEECCTNAAHTMDEIDPAGFYMYKDLCGLDCTFPGGFQGLIENLMSELPHDLVTYNRPVRCVHWNNTEKGENAVTIECHDGERVAADHVILTVPLGYMKKHHSTLFSPPLPAHKLHSIQRQGFGTCNKIFIEFDSPWWDADIEVIYLLWEDEEEIVDQVSDISKSWTRKMSSLTVIKSSESPVLCGWIAGKESEYMESLSDQEVTSAITELLCTFSGNPRITPRRILRTQWFHDPWTHGSYFHAAISSSMQDLENLMEPLPVEGSQSQPLQVLFAGEATHPYYYSTVHGALLTGRREADRLISHYSPSSLCTP